MAKTKPTITLSHYRPSRVQIPAIKEKYTHTARTHSQDSLTSAKHNTASTTIFNILLYVPLTHSHTETEENIQKNESKDADNSCG